MHKNVGTIDRFIRIIAGLGLILLAVMSEGLEWGYLGIIPLFTGIIGWCPPYALFGVSTCSKK